MIDSNETSQEFHPVEVVDGKDGGSLVFVADECEALALAGFLIPNQVDVDNLAILREDTDHVAFGQIVGKATGKDPGRVSVLKKKSKIKWRALAQTFDILPYLIVPGFGGAGNAHFDLTIVHLVQVLHVRDRIHGEWFSGA